MKILPIPKKIMVTKEHLLDKRLNVFHNDFTEKLLRIINDDFEISAKSLTRVYIYKKDFEFTDAYKLIIDKKKIVIEATNETAAFYAITTLKQIFENPLVETLEIFDYPDLKIRGVLLDISRSKVPNLQTLKELIKMFAYLKINHLELYIEGFSFEYVSFKEYLIDRNYISKKDYLEIQEYANSYYIDFVPNQNGFGHMGEWLKQKEFKHLREVDDLFYMWGCFREPSTLNPLDKGSVEFVSKLYNDMLPNTSSKYFNMNFDEPYELGHGKSKNKVLQTSLEDVYIEYFNKLLNVVKNKHKKIPLIWADVLINNPKAISKIDKDTIFIDWGYHKNYPFDNHAKELQKLNAKYILAPGTSSWSTITGRYLDMKTTIENSSIAAKKHNGLGIIVTDWGDIGHFQYLPVSYLGFIFAASASWSDATIDDSIYYLQKIINDTHLTEVLIKLSKYSMLEGDYREYGTRLFSAIIYAEHSRNQENGVAFFKEKMNFNLIEESNHKDLENFFDEIELTLNLAKPSQIKEEIKNSLRLLKTLKSINFKLLKDCSDFDEEILQLQHYLTEHKQLWLVRNIIEGYKQSASRIYWLIEILIRLSRKENI